MSRSKVLNLFKPRPTALTVRREMTRAITPLHAGPEFNVMQTAAPKPQPPHVAAEPVPLLPRRSAMSAGPSVGMLSSTDEPNFRSLVSEEGILQGIDQKGYQSAAMRAGLPISATPPGDDELTNYSGIHGKKSTFRDSRLVGVNKDPIYTAKVGAKTSGMGDLDQQSLDALKAQPNRAMRLDEIDAGRTSPPLSLYPVESAFQRTGEINEHPVHGEEVAVGQVPPENLGHTAIWPLDHPMNDGSFGPPGQVHPNYLPNLGKATESSLEEPQKFGIQTRAHEDPANPGRKIEIDTFTPQSHEPWEDMLQRTGRWPQHLGKKHS